jgi:hypothetical protein
MASNKYRYPPAPGNGSGTFSDDIVGLQTVDGGGLTQGNFEFTTSVVEKVNRSFNTGVFSSPISLDDLNVDGLLESRVIAAKNYRVYPNYDISQVTNFTLYGSLQKRFSTSVTKIINYFPAAIQVDSQYYDYSTANTANNISYDLQENLTTFTVDVTRFKNPFDIDYSVNATRNISVRPLEVSPLRNLTTQYGKYAIYVNDMETEYLVYDFTPSTKLSAGTVTFVVVGDLFSGASSTTDSIVIKPSKFETEKAFKDPFDEVEDFLLNRLVTPKYTAKFQVPVSDDEGRYQILDRLVTWALDGLWNLDIRTNKFENYLNNLNNIAEDLDDYKTNLISRFLTTAAFHEFDTQDQKVEKVLQLYGRSFDETKKFIDALGYITSVNYVPKDDIPSQLLYNLALTLGWNTDISPITNNDFLESVFGTKNQSIYPGQTRDKTPNELNSQFYRNLILNSAWLFKSKGTAKAVQWVMRSIGAPEALVEFNEIVYLADGPINMDQFNQKYVQISGGTYNDETPTFDSTNTFKIRGTVYTGFTTDSVVRITNLTRPDFPVDSNGYPTTPANVPFELGAGWYRSTEYHRSPEVNQVNATKYTGTNPDSQTILQPFTYGQQYFDTFREFPYLNMGYELTREYDNQKSWPQDQQLRKNTSAGFNTYYRVSDERLVLNAKNIDLYMNMGQGLLYDVWDMSRKYDYPIPNSGLTNPYPSGVDWTVIDPKPKEKTFFEFAQNFYNNMINVRNRQTSGDGKGGGYPQLQRLYENYLNSEQAVNIPSNKYTYQKMIDYTLGIGDYWMRLVEQVLPASTIWMGGQKMENSAFHRQKVMWRRQRGCEIIPVSCIPCEFDGQILGYDCIDQTVSCGVYPWIEDSSTSTAGNFQQMLTDVVAQVSSAYTLCDTNTIVSDWYVDLRLDSDILVQEKFYTGYGGNDVPTNSDWINGLDSKLEYLYQDGLNYFINGNTIIIANSSCYDDFTNKRLYLNVGIDITISCQ